MDTSLFIKKTQRKALTSITKINTSKLDHISKLPRPTFKIKSYQILTAASKSNSRPILKGAPAGGSIFPRTFARSLFLRVVFMSGGPLIKHATRRALL